MALVLTRKKNERILLGDTITVEVLQCGLGQVRLGITAPDDVRIDREEVRLRLRMDSGEEWRRIEDELDYRENCMDARVEKLIEAEIVDPAPAIRTY